MAKLKDLNLSVSEMLQKIEEDTKKYGVMEYETAIYGDIVTLYVYGNVVDLFNNGTAYLENEKIAKSYKKIGCAIKAACQF